MRLKIFIAALALLFTVKFASAQVSIEYGTSISNTGPTNHYVLHFYGESATAYVVSAQIDNPNSYYPHLYGVATGVSGSLNTPNNISYNGPGTFEGDLYVNYSGFGGAAFYVTVGLYNSTTDQMWYETYYTGVGCN